MSSQSRTFPPVPIETPCVQVCEIDQGLGLCKGCGRTLAEVAAWGTLTVLTRRQIMEQLPHRLSSVLSTSDSRSGGAPSAAGADLKGRN